MTPRYSCMIIIILEKSIKGLLIIIGMTKRAIVRRTLSVASLLLAILSFSRVIVIFLESMSQVNQERQQDMELLDLCAGGTINPL